MKKVIALTAAIAGLAGPAIALAVQPDWIGPYNATNGVGFMPDHHSLDINHGASFKAHPCSSKYSWGVGYPKSAGFSRSNAPIKVSRSGRFSATRANQEQVKHEAKVQVTGAWTTNAKGHGTWQVVGCATKHHFKFYVTGG